MKFTDRLNMIIGGESSAPKKSTAANKFTPAINNITGKYPKESKGNSIVFTPKPKKTWKPKANYKPADGSGTGM